MFARCTCLQRVSSFVVAQHNFFFGPVVVCLRPPSTRGPTTAAGSHTLEPKWLPIMLVHSVCMCNDDRDGPLHFLRFREEQRWSQSSNHVAIQVVQDVHEHRAGSLTQFIPARFPCKKITVKYREAQSCVSSVSLTVPTCAPFSHHPPLGGCCRAHTEHQIEILAEQDRDGFAFSSRGSSGCAAVPQVKTSVPAVKCLMYPFFPKYLAEVVVSAAGVAAPTTMDGHTARVQLCSETSNNPAMVRTSQPAASMAATSTEVCHHHLGKEFSQIHQTAKQLPQLPQTFLSISLSSRASLEMIHRYQAENSGLRASWEIYCYQPEHDECGPELRDSEVVQNEPMHRFKPQPTQRQRCQLVNPPNHNTQRRLLTW